MEKSNFNYKNIFLIILIAFFIISLGFSTAFAFSEYEKKAADKLYQDLSQEYEISSFEKESSEYQISKRLERNVIKNKFKNAEFKLHYVDNELINAFYIGDGNIMLFRGLLQNLDTKDQLAALIAHEMGHAVEEHMTEDLKRNTGLSILNLLFNHFTDNEYQTLSNVAHNLIKNGYSREQEQEADIYAAELLLRSGYDPQGLVELMKIFKENSHNVKLLEFIQTHPLPESRIEYIEKYIAKRKNNKETKNRNDEQRNHNLDSEVKIEKQNFANGYLSFVYPKNWELKKEKIKDQEIKFNYQLNSDTIKGEVYLKDLSNRRFMETTKENFDYRAIDARDKGFKVEKYDLSSQSLKIYQLQLTKENNFVLEYYITDQNDNKMLRLNFKLNKSNYSQEKEMIENLISSLKFK